MTQRTIYFDESGFTGYNLLDPDQPVFAVASADIEDARAEEILRSSFPHNRADEHHFTRIWRSRRQRNGLRAFCNNLHEVADACFAEEARGAGWGEATPVDRRRSGWVTSLNVSELSRELQTKPDAGPRGAPSMGSWTA